LECSETNSVLNGWWILTQNITEKFKLKTNDASHQLASPDACL
jgi:hypothetical protein